MAVRWLVWACATDHLLEHGLSSTAAFEQDLRGAFLHRSLRHKHACDVSILMFGKMGTFSGWSVSSGDLVAILRRVICADVCRGCLQQGRWATEVPLLGSRFHCPAVAQQPCLYAGSPLWPQVPQAFQVYRLVQLARSLWFAHYLAAPLWLVYLLKYFLILWAVNFGAGKRVSFLMEHILQSA